PPKARFPWARVATTLATLLLLGGAAVVGYPYLRPMVTRLFYSVGPKKSLPLLSIQSQPEGATVTVDGTELGVTPMVLDNTYASGQDVPVQLTLKGHKPWKGTFSGGQPVDLNVRLKR
ncbi:MAG TPA: PEGA domain-containing protein, partial [Archangium sp.]